MISIEYFTQVHRNNFPTYVAKQKNISQDRNLPSNAFDDFSQTAYADDNTPNAMGDYVKKTFQEVQKASNILFHKFSL